MVNRNDMEKSTINKIRIESIEGNPACSVVEINDKQVRCVSYTIHHEAQNLAEMAICAYSDTIIEEMGIVNWVVIPRTIDEAIEVLKRAAKDGCLEVSHVSKLVDEIFDIIHKRSR